MKQNSSFIIGFTIIIALCLAGCKKSEDIVGPNNNTSFTQSDQQALDNMISSDLLLSASGDQATLDDGAEPLEKVDTAITPLAWARHFTSWTGSKTYNKIDDSTVIATISNTLTGNLLIRSTSGVVRKPITMTTTRNVKFEKRTGKDSTKWAEKFVSAMQGNTTSGVDTISIVDLQFFVGNDTIDITSPAYNNYLQMGAVGRFGLHVLARSSTRKFTVQTTVVSSAPDSDVVVLYHPNNTVMRIRERMLHVGAPINNGNGTYTHTYRRSWVGDYPGIYTIGVSALSKESLFDNQAAVTSQDWGIPYIVQ